MQEEKKYQDSNFPEVLLEQFEEALKDELNLYETPSDEEFKQILTSIIREYENEFHSEFTDIFIYNYYSNLLKGKVIDKIIDFVKTKESLNNQGKDTVLKSERAACQDVLYLFDFDFNQDKENKFISNITGKEIPIGYEAAQIITNDDVFFRPPNGDPKLRGQHINFTIEYSLEYWLKFKEDIQKYIDTFEKTHSEDFLEDLKDYRFWLNKYRSLIYLLNQKNILKEEGGKHVKN